MCYNSTNNTLYNCDGNLSLRAILIFIFTGISTLISLVFVIFFCISKPVWLDFELKNNVDDDDDDLEISLDDDDLEISLDDDELEISLDDDELEMSGNREEENLL